MTELTKQEAIDRVMEIHGQFGATLAMLEDTLVDFRQGFEPSDEQRSKITEMVEGFREALTFWREALAGNSNGNPDGNQNLVPHYLALADELLGRLNGLQ